MVVKMYYLIGVKNGLLGLLNSYKKVTWVSTAKGFTAWSVNYNILVSIPNSRWNVQGTRWDCPESVNFCPHFERT